MRIAIDAKRDKIIPRVNIIIPTYNSAKYISETIKRVLNQTYKDCEIIVVDDVFTDNTIEILKKYNSKFKYIYRENRGLSAVRNTGIKNSKVIMEIKTSRMN